ncbi:MAG TPA: universal stress protein, partial [Gemmatimonadaceae bacterium]|nr:universal stress protein [Gemmatimonadaceae bacterium]
MPLRTLLVPLDGSSLAEQALVPAIAIARASGATLHIAEVFVQYLMDVRAFGTAELQANIETQLEEEARLYLAGIGQDVSVRLAGPVESHLIRTHPLQSPLGETTAIVRGLERLAHRIHPDLIVMATHARGGVSRAWLGSVADALVRRGGAPLLLIHPRMEPSDAAVRFQHVLVPLDGSERAEVTLPLAITVASLSGARVTLVLVIVPDRVRVPRAPVSRVNRAQVARDETNATAYLANVRQQFAAAGITIDTATVVDEHPARAILDYAEQHAVDLIAMSTRGLGAVKRF